MHLTLRDPNQSTYNTQIRMAFPRPLNPIPLPLTPKPQINHGRCWCRARTWHSSSLAKHTAEIAKQPRSLLRPCQHTLTIWEQAKCLRQPPSSCRTRRPEAPALSTTSTTSTKTTMPKVDTTVRLGLKRCLNFGCCPGCLELLCM